MVIFDRRASIVHTVPTVRLGFFSGRRDIWPPKSIPRDERLATYLHSHVRVVIDTFASVLNWPLSCTMYSPTRPMFQSADPPAWDRDRTYWYKILILLLLDPWAASWHQNNLIGTGLVRSYDSTLHCRCWWQLHRSVFGNLLTTVLKTSILVC